MPLRSKAPVSFAIQAPAAIAPIVEYPKMIFLGSAARAPTGINNRNKTSVRRPAFSFRSTMDPSFAPSGKFSQPAAEDRDALGALDVLGEAVLVFARVGNAARGRLRPVVVQGGDFRPDKVRPVGPERRLHLLLERRDAVDRVGAGDAAALGDFRQIHLVPGRRRHSRLFLMAAEVVGVVEDDDRQIFRPLLGDGPARPPV